ncbi:YadA-like family protein [Dyella caseinilytica]|uniref:YadA-like family protein n=1 Tax=Dyella caseinilytica TaxID=1849581 RepID=A0ABX7GNW6_9GAMM|nr:YadA-like family protein [Dyella caseinilytica]QRN52120.1 YadA-like family protein [Dyella caseinilytica]GGA13555.1 adhesin [Dyella caseinilytica]
MNTIYRIVWNAATGKWVVASELAKGRKKKSTRTFIAQAITSIVLASGAASAMAQQTCMLPDGTNGTTNDQGICAADFAIGGGTATGTDVSAATAVGHQSTANGAGAVAVGDTANSQGTGAVAIGGNTNALADYSIAIGGASTQGNAAMASGLRSISMGVLSQASGDYSMAQGSNATASGTYSIALGGASTAGNGAQATGENSVAMGVASKASTTNSMALGPYSTASGSTSTALGYNTKATGANSVALGAGSVSERSGTVSVGSDVAGSSFTRQIVNVGAGTQANDAVNVSQLAPVVAGLGGGASINSTTGAVTGPTYNVQGHAQTTVGDALSALDGNLTTAQSSITNLQNNTSAASRYFKANGLNDGTDDASAAGTGSIAIGPSALAQGADGNVAIGNQAVTGAAATDAVAFGSGAHASAASTTAIGAGALAQGNNSTAVGQGAVANLSGTVALGQGAIASLANSAALGQNAQTYGTNSVALGTNSVADRANTVSVGSSTAQRQIEYLAAGTQVTDAVNVSQLNGVASSLGGGTGVAADGSITSPTYTVQNGTQKTVGDALDALDGGLTTAQGDITHLQGQMADAVTYDDNTHGSVTLGGTSATSPVTLHNVAPGEVSSTSTDAVNGSQLNATNQQVAQNTSNIGSINTSVTNLNGRVTTNENDITNLQTGQADAVMYDDSTHGSVTLGGTSATAPIALHNVAEGELSSTSTDAVNGSQLYATNQQVGQNTTDITNLQNNFDNGTIGLVQQDPATGNVTVAAGKTGTLVDFTGTEGARQLTGVAAGNVSATSTDAVNGSQLYATNQEVEQNAGDISNLDGRVTTNEGNITHLQGQMADAVMYDDNTHGSVTLGGASATAPVALHNVAAGELSATSRDAVNGSQLYATNQQVSQNTTDITNLQNNFDDGTTGLVQQAATGANLTVGKNTDGAAVDFADKDGNTRTLSNVSAGTADTDAVNVSQLKSTGLVDANGNTIAAVTYDQNTDGTSNYGSVTLGASNASGPVALHNVAAGTEDTDAVNMSQLNATNAQVANNTTNITNLDGRVTTNETNISNLQQQIGAGSVGLVQQDATSRNITVAADTDGTTVDFADKDGKTRTLSNVSAGTADTDAVNVSQLKSTGLIDANGNTMAAVTYDQNADGTPNYNSATMGGGKSDGPVTIHNVAAGTEDTDAVNVSQLKSAGLVDNNGNTMDAVVYDPGSNRGQVTLGGVGAAAPVVLTNVADGVNQYDAVNFGQLSGVQSDLQSQINNMGGQVTNIDGRVTNIEGANSTPVSGSSGSISDDGSNLAVGSGSNASGGGSSAVGNNSTATGSNSTAVGNNASVTASNGTAVGQGATVQSGATNSVALGAGSVATTANTVSVGSAGNERTISNVAAGVNATDAANVGQVQAAQNWAQSYTDQKVGQLNSRITSVGQHADAGTAAAIAMTNIPQAYQPNQSSLGAGVGAFRGQAAVAVGMSTITPNGRWVLKGSITGNSQGDIGVGMGASMVW